MTPKIDPPAPHDPVKKPSHYTDSKIDWRDVADDWKLSWRLTHALKYLKRHQGKGNPVQDLEKMIQYAQMEVDKLKTKEVNDLAKRINKQFWRDWVGTVNNVSFIAPTSDEDTQPSIEPPHDHRASSR